MRRMNADGDSTLLAWREPPSHGGDPLVSLMTFSPVTSLKIVQVPMPRYRLLEAPTHVSSSLLYSLQDLADIFISPGSLFR